MTESATEEETMRSRTISEVISCASGAETWAVRKAALWVTGRLIYGSIATNNLLIRCGRVGEIHVPGCPLAEMFEGGHRSSMSGTDRILHELIGQRSKNAHIGALVAHGGRASTVGFEIGRRVSKQRPQEQEGPC